jgi:hypothetical protein
MSVKFEANNCYKAAKKESMKDEIKAYFSLCKACIDLHKKLYLRIVHPNILILQDIRRETSGFSQRSRGEVFNGEWNP